MTGSDRALELIYHHYRGAVLSEVRSLKIWQNQIRTDKPMPDQEFGSNDLYAIYYTIQNCETEERSYYYKDSGNLAFAKTGSRLGIWSVSEVNKEFVVEESKELFLNRKALTVSIKSLMPTGNVFSELQLLELEVLSGFIDPRFFDQIVMYSGRWVPKELFPLQYPLVVSSKSLMTDKWVKYYELVSFDFVDPTRYFGHMSD